MIIPSYYQITDNMDVYEWMAQRPPHRWAHLGTAGQRQALDALYGAVLARIVRLPYKGGTIEECREDCEKAAKEGVRLAALLQELAQGEGEGG